MELKLKVDGLDGMAFEIPIASYTSSVQKEAGVKDSTFNDIYVSLEMNQYSPRLARACADGLPIKAVAIAIADDEGRRYMELRLADCLVSSYTASGGGYGSVQENVTFTYRKIEWVFVDARTGEEVAERGIVRQPLPSRNGNGQSGPTTVTPNTAFIVMWMDSDRPELDDVCGAIKDVCRTFGITALRADDIEHSDQITELVLSRIASSEFVIADLTGERPNVYYEVGFAQAIGKRPILVRRQESHVHFDLSVHNVRAYKNLTKLKEILNNRFEAILGRSASSK